MSPTLLAVASSASFNPVLDITWVGAWWAGGPEFRALGLADGAAVTTFPDEVGTADMTRSAAGPTFVASSSSLGNRPAVATDGLTVLRTAASAVTVTRPYSVFWLGRSTATTDSTVYVGGQTSGAAMAVMAGVGALGGLCSLFGGFGAGNLAALATTKRVWTAVCATGAADKMRTGGATTTINTGDTLLTRLAVGGYADLVALVGTETHFVGVYQGDLTAHARFAELEAWAA